MKYKDQVILALKAAYDAAREIHDDYEEMSLRAIMAAAESLAPQLTQYITKNPAALKIFTLKMDSGLPSSLMHAKDSTRNEFPRRCFSIYPNKVSTN